MIAHRLGNVFLSHSSRDKNFVGRLATDLKTAGVKVWYDDWAIDYGESIVEKVYNGLAESDFLIVVLSKESIKSRWVREELNVMTMKRLQGKDIRVIPLLLDDCEVPEQLSHLKYIDFRISYDNALLDLNRTIMPASELWSELEEINNKFKATTKKIVESNIDDEVGNIPITLHNLLQKALAIRVKIEVLHTRKPRETTDVDFKEDPEIFKNIGYLFENGVDVRSAVWHALVSYNSMLAHAQAGDLKMSIFVEMLDENGYFAKSWRIGMIRPPIFQDDYDLIGNKVDGLRVAVRELNAISEMLCQKSFRKREFYIARE